VSNRKQKVERHTDSSCQKVVQGAALRYKTRTRKFGKTDK